MAARRDYGSGSIRERRPGVWQLRFRGHNRSFEGTRKQAQAALARFVTDLEGSARRTSAATITLGEHLDDWLLTSRIAESTRATYRQALRHLPSAYRAKPLRQLGTRDLDLLYAALTKAGVSAHQVRKLHTVLSSALAQAVRWELVDRNRAAGAQLPALPETQVQAPSIDALERILVAAAGDLALAVWLRLVLATGARRGEVLALRWSAVDLEAGVVIVRASLNEDRTAKSTKSNRERHVSIDAQTAETLRFWRIAQGSAADAVGVELVADPFVLSHDPDGATPWRPDGATQRFRRLVKRAGVPGVRLHDLRHAHATLLLRQGVPMNVVSERLGHARTSITVDVYGHVLDGDDRAAADTIGRILGA